MATTSPSSHDTISGVVEAIGPTGVALTPPYDSGKSHVCEPLQVSGQMVDNRALDERRA
jgi:hypothetical protein